MDKIKIICPVCGVILEAADDPANEKKSVMCPNCKTKSKFKDFKQIRPTAPQSDETEVRPDFKGQAGYLLDKTTHKEYPLRVGVALVGRKPSKTPPRADIAIETADMEMSREHIYIEVMKGRDARYHVYACNAKNKNITLINGETLQDGDKIGLKHGDILTLGTTNIQYVGNAIDDETDI